MNKKYYRLLFLGFFLANSPMVKTTIQKERDVFEEFTSEDKRKEAEIYISEIINKESILEKSFLLVGSEALESYKNFNERYGKIQFLDSINYQELVKNNNELLNLGKQLNEKRDKLSLEVEKFYGESKENDKNGLYYSVVNQLSETTVCSLQKNHFSNALKNFLEKTRHLKNLPKGEINAFPTIQTLFVKTDDDAMNILLKSMYTSGISSQNSWNQFFESMYNKLFWELIDKIESKVDDLDEFTKKEFEKYVVNKVNFFIKEDEKKYKAKSFNENKLSNSLLTKNNKNSNKNLYIIAGVVLSAIVVGGLVYYWKNQRADVD